MERNGVYEQKWPEAGLSAKCFLHEIMNFRYHWHPDQYELNIVLTGRQQYSCDRQTFLLEEGDMILVNPNEGHASYAAAPDTVAFVMHFSGEVMRSFAPKNKRLVIKDACSFHKDKDELRYRTLRALAAKLILAMSHEDTFSCFTARACSEMIISILCTEFTVDFVDSSSGTDPETQKIMKMITEYIEQHYQDKITLEEIASITQYNRTYISTLFHKAVGISFYDYLMRVRLQNAINDLAQTDLKLTDIAMKNGFADLKSFNARFRELVGILPSEYRNQISEHTAYAINSRKYISPDTPVINDRIKQWIK